MPAPIGAHLEGLRTRLEERVNRTIGGPRVAVRSPPREHAAAGQVPPPTQVAEPEPPPLIPRRTGESAERPARRRQRPSPDEYDPDREAIAACLADFAEQLTDLAPLNSSVTRASRLYRTAGVDIDAFTRALYRARAITRERQAGIKARQPGADRSAPKPRMGYFFAVLEDILSLKRQAACDAHLD
jgi:hypothetical protein